MSIWYYADHQNRQIGPVSAEAVRDALRLGEVSGASQVWREGMPQWVELQSVLGELGIAAGAVPPPRRIIMAGGRPVVVAPQSKTGMWIIMLVVVGFGGLMVLGILLAIAIPAYSDYSVRAKIAEALSSNSNIKTMVAEHWYTHQQCPSNGDEGFGDPASYATDMIETVEIGPGDDEKRCTIQIALRPTREIPDNGQITLTLNDQTWEVSTQNVPARYLPASLRNSAY
jgi:type IV pilus assembly protein PilA